jgi:hypothetical protein
MLPKLQTLTSGVGKQNRASRRPRRVFFTNARGRIDPSLCGAGSEATGSRGDRTRASPSVRRTPHSPALLFSGVDISEKCTDKAAVDQVFHGENRLILLGESSYVRKSNWIWNCPIQFPFLYGYLAGRVQKQVKL